MFSGLRSLLNYTGLTSTDSPIEQPAEAAQNDEFVNQLSVSARSQEGEQVVARVEDEEVKEVPLVNDCQLRCDKEDQSRQLIAVDVQTKQVKYDSTTTNNNNRSNKKGGPKSGKNKQKQDNVTTTKRILDAVSSKLSVEELVVPPRQTLDQLEASSHQLLPDLSMSNYGFDNNETMPLESSGEKSQQDTTIEGYEFKTHDADGIKVEMISITKGKKQNNKKNKKGGAKTGNNKTNSPDYKNAELSVHYNVKKCYQKSSSGSKEKQSLDVDEIMESLENNEEAETCSLDGSWELLDLDDGQKNVNAKVSKKTTQTSTSTKKTLIDTNETVQQKRELESGSSSAGFDNSVRGDHVISRIKSGTDVGVSQKGDDYIHVDASSSTCSSRGPSTANLSNLEDQGGDTTSSSSRAGENDGLVQVDKSTNNNNNTNKNNSARNKQKKKRANNKVDFWKMVPEEFLISNRRDGQNKMLMETSVHSEFNDFIDAEIMLPTDSWKIPMVNDWCNLPVSSSNSKTPGPKVCVRKSPTIKREIGGEIGSTICKDSTPSTPASSMMPPPVAPIDNKSTGNELKVGGLRLPQGSQSNKKVKVKVSPKCSSSSSENQEFDSSDLGTEMEESWYVTPPPCFTGSKSSPMGPGYSNKKSDDIENALIEHPSIYMPTQSKSLDDSIKSSNKQQGKTNNKPEHESWVTPRSSKNNNNKSKNNNSQKQTSSQKGPESSESSGGSVTEISMTDGEATLDPESFDEGSDVVFVMDIARSPDQSPSNQQKNKRKSSNKFSKSRSNNTNKNKNNKTLKSPGGKAERANASQKRKSGQKEPKKKLEKNKENIKADCSMEESMEILDHFYGPSQLPTSKSSPCNNCFTIVEGNPDSFDEPLDSCEGTFTAQDYLDDISASSWTPSVSPVSAPWWKTIKEKQAKQAQRDVDRLIRDVNLVVRGSESQQASNSVTPVVKPERRPGWQLKRKRAYKPLSQAQTRKHIQQSINNQQRVSASSNKQQFANGLSTIKSTHIEQHDDFDEDEITAQQDQLAFYTSACSSPDSFIGRIKSTLSSIRKRIENIEMDSVILNPINNNLSYQPTEGAIPNPAGVGGPVPPRSQPLLGGSSDKLILAQRKSDNKRQTAPSSKHQLQRQNDCAKRASSNRRIDRKTRMHQTINGVSINRKVQTQFH